jgi:chemotaxis protein histidine kinase CheA
MHLDEELLAVFCDEALEHLDHFVLIWESEPFPLSHQLQNELFRATHSLKGAARSVGLHQYSAAVNLLESKLRLCSFETQRESKEHSPFFLDLARLLKDWVLRQQQSSSYELSLEEWNKLQKKVESYQILAPTGATAVKSVERVGAHPKSHSRSHDPEISEFSPSVRHDLIRVPFVRLQTLLREQEQLIWKFLMGYSESAPATAHREMLTLALKNHRDILEFTRDSSKGLFEKLQKTAMDVATKHHLPLRLEVQGDDLFVDRRILDALSEAMIHLVRNAIDHGFRNAAVAKNGAKFQPTLKLCGSRTPKGDLEFKVQDNGSGLDKTLILAKAGQEGIVPESHASDKDDWVSLIFRPKFSTRDELTEFSGLGMGLSLVHQIVNQVGGTVKVMSKPQQGTEFTLKIPGKVCGRWTSIWVCQVGNQVWCLPDSENIELFSTFKPSEEEIIHWVESQWKVNPLEGLPLDSKSGMLKLTRTGLVPSKRGNLKSPFVFCFLGGKRSASLPVDRILAKWVVEKPSLTFSSPSDGVICGPGKCVDLPKINWLDFNLVQRVKEYMQKFTKKAA